MPSEESSDNETDGPQGQTEPDGGLRGKWSRRFFGLDGPGSRDAADADGDSRRQGLASAGAGLELAVGIGLFGGLGFLGDRAWGTLPWLTVTGSLLGMAAGMYLLIKSLGDSSK
ncbi:MAG: AtpZ/AtpI family protein [Phycisphaeraceae bacterium]